MLVVCIKLSAKSEHSLACIVLQDVRDPLRNSRGKLPRIGYGAKSLPLAAFGKPHESQSMITVRPRTLTE